MTGRRIELATMNHHYMFYDLDVFLKTHPSWVIRALSCGHHRSIFLWITSKTIQRNAF